ncbi:MAG: tRNA-dihydrouridine synthase, partial [Clostridia bacterium]|nr:tRNA-dihydrouridine synthase [Clostridia bacterium]
MLKIRNVALPSDIILGPMAGVTDLPFRRLCIEFGCKTTTSEMISSKAMHFQDKKTLVLLQKHNSEQFFIVQIFGSDPLIMAECAKRVEDMGIANIIDINMGCPAPKIVNNGDGSALMKNPVLASEIIQAVVKSVSVPVTVKFRSGWDKTSINAVEFAK